MKKILLLLFLTCSAFADNCAIKPGTAHTHFIVHAIPKCGTHFMRHTISLMTDEPEKLVGLPTQEELSQNRREKEFLRFFEPYEKLAYQRIRQNRFRLISMIRDPRDALLSLAVYMRSFEGQGTERDFFLVAPNYDQLSFDKQLLSLMTSSHRGKNYLLYYKDRIPWSSTAGTYTVKYENLVGSQGGGSDLFQLMEVMNISRHLCLPFTMEEAQEIAASLYTAAPPEIIDGKEFHHGQIGGWKEFFKEKHKKLFKKELGELLITLGYEKDLNW